MEEKVSELRSLGKTELSEEFRIRLSGELEELREKTRQSYSRIITAFPSATSHMKDVKEQLQNIHTWAQERREASIEMKARIKEAKKDYKTKDKEIDDFARNRK